MYDASADPYCWLGTTVLKNIAGIFDQDMLDRFEAANTMQRADEPAPNGRLGARHYQAMHRHLFQDVYAWAGAFRTVRLAKDGSAFCYPEYITPEMRSLFENLRNQRYLRGMTADEFGQHAAAFLATLNAIHPFREGNGRTQVFFLAVLADRANHPLQLDQLHAEPFLSAMVQSFKGNARPLTEEIRRLIA